MRIEQQFNSHISKLTTCSLNARLKFAAIVQCGNKCKLGNQLQFILNGWKDAADHSKRQWFYWNTLALNTYISFYRFNLFSCLWCFSSKLNNCVKNKTSTHFMVFDGLVLCESLTTASPKIIAADCSNGIINYELFILPYCLD